MVQEAEAYIQLLDEDLNLYNDMKWTDAGKAMPARFDLRDTGVVNAMTNPKKWSIGWGFASIAASETAILSRLGMTGDDWG